MRPQNGERPRPRNADDGLSIERLGNRLDDQFISPSLFAQRAAPLNHGRPPTPKLQRLKRCVCPIDIDRVNHAALYRSNELIRALLPSGMTSGTQYVAPTRDERRLLSIFLDSGQRIDFADVAYGDGLVCLVAHVLNVSHRDGAQLIAHLLGIEWGAASNIGDATEGAQ
jgi:hypothetical protein